jgi:hypothetical protein
MFALISFRKLLVTTTENVSSFLIPNRGWRLSDLQADSCNSLQKDSPYSISHDSIDVKTFGGSQYTTFKMTITKDLGQCTTGNSCCNSVIDSILLDVSKYSFSRSPYISAVKLMYHAVSDPEFQVRFATFNGKSSNLILLQDEYGLSIKPPARDILSNTMSSGISLSLEWLNTQI